MVVGKIERKKRRIKIDFPARYIRDFNDFKYFVNDLVDYVETYKEEVDEEYRQYELDLENDTEELESKIVDLKEENKKLLQQNKKLEEYKFMYQQLCE